MTEAKPLSAEEVIAYLENHDELLAQLRNYDGPEPQVGNMCEVVNAMGRLLATISTLQAENTLLTARLDHLMLDPDNDVIPDNDPAVLAELAALPPEKLCERLRGVYALYPGTAPRRFYTGAISHEAARRVEAVEAEVERLRQNQRTPHTHEICPYGPERCDTMYDYQWCDCEKTDCPMRSQEKK
jgi:hypothetical protein